MSMEGFLGVVSNEAAAIWNRALIQAHDGGDHSDRIRQAVETIGAQAALLVEEAVAAERARIAALMSADDLRALATWHDADDNERPYTFPGTRPLSEVGLQRDLRALADLLDGGDS